MQAGPRASQHACHVVEHGVGLRLVFKQLHVRVEEVALGHMNLYRGGGVQERWREEGGKGGACQTGGVSLEQVTLSHVDLLTRGRRGKGRGLLNGENGIARNRCRPCQRGNCL